MDKYVQAYAYSVNSRLGNLATIMSMRERWHNLPNDGFKLSEDLSEIRYSTSHPEEAFSHLPSGERLTIFSMHSSHDNVQTSWTTSMGY